MEETKVIYYIDDEDTPYMMKIMESPSKVTLKDFKAQLNRPYKKFFFRSTDDDIGVVKEEITDDDMSLPNVNGRVVCWVVTGEQGSQSGSETGGSKEKLNSTKDGDDVSLVSKSSSRRHKLSSHRSHRPHGHSRHRRRHRVGNAAQDSAVSGTDIDSQSEYTSASYTTTDMESVADTEDSVSRVSASTLTSLQPRRKVYTKHRPKRSMSMSTVTATSVTNASMQIVQVTLNMDTVNFLGISIVGQTSEDGAGGIFVGSVMKGGAVAADGRIEPGDMLLEVNEISFENMSNDDAVKALREIVQQPGPITLTVAKCWEPEPVVPQFEPRMEPIRPIDPSAWVQQTNQLQADYAYGGRPFTGSPTLSTMTSNSSPSITSSVPETEREAARLTITTPMYRIAKMLSNPTSGLEIKDRVWLKMTIPKSFIGSDMVDWLHTNVDGFLDRRHARKYAALMLKHGFIRHTVNKITFSEQCYYVFGDFKAAANSLPSEFSNLHLSADSGEDTLGPLPGTNVWGSSEGEFSLPGYEFFTRGPHQASSSSKSNSPSPESKAAAAAAASAVPRHSGSSGGSSITGQPQGQPSPQNLTPAHPPTKMNQHLPTIAVGESPDNSNTNNPVNGAAVHPYPVMRMKHSLSTSSGFTSVSQQHLRGGRATMPPDSISLRSANMVGPHAALGVPGNLGNSRESFQEALDNPCEYFIDVM